MGQEAETSLTGGGREFSRWKEKKKHQSIISHISTFTTSLMEKDALLILKKKMLCCYNSPMDDQAFVFGFVI